MIRESEQACHLWTRNTTKDLFGRLEVQVLNQVHVHRFMPEVINIAKAIQRKQKFRTFEGMKVEFECSVSDKGTSLEWFNGLYVRHFDSRGPHNTRASKKINEDARSVCGPCTMKWLRLSRCPPNSYLALYLISSSALDFIAGTNLAASALAPSGSSSFITTWNEPQRSISRSLSSFLCAFLKTLCSSHSFQLP